MLETSVAFACSSFIATASSILRSRAQQLLDGEHTANIRTSPTASLKVWVPQNANMPREIRQYRAVLDIVD